MRSREDSVLHRWSTEGLLHLPDMRAHPERTWATSQRELQQWGESPGPALSCFLAPGVSSFLELWREPLLTRITTSGNLHDLPGLERSAYFLILEYWEINISLATERAFLVAQSVKNLLAMQGPDFDPWVGKIFWKRKWQPTPLFLPGKSHGQRNLVGDGP